MLIQDGPHYELPASELAAWIDRQGADVWWTIDGDPYLTGRLPSPCRGDELAIVLRQSLRTLLVRDQAGEATGQVLTADRLDPHVERLGNSIHMHDPSRPKPSWADDRFLWLSWKGERNEWMLAEDRDATVSFRDVETHPVARP
jgi:hypothetical protein